jgi:hypothetical protein
MPNEKEVKDAARERRDRGCEAICSATGLPCECLAGGGCRSLTPDSALGGEEQLVRKYPAPEIREVRRKVVTAIAMIDEIGGEL